MGFFDRLSRLLRANLNDLLNKAEDPVKILDQSLEDMQGDLVRLRQAVATAIASQKRLGRQAQQSGEQAQAWYQRAEQAMQNGEEDLAREALIRRKTLQETFTSLSKQFEGQEGQVQTLKRSLVSLEGKIAEAKTKKDMLKARAQAAKAQQQLQSAVGHLDGDSAMKAFERMEEKVEALEVSSQVSAELAGSELERKFAALDGSNDDIDDELRNLKKTIDGGLERFVLPGKGKVNLGEISSPTEIDVEAVDVSEVDSDLENLKKSIEGK